MGKLANAIYKVMPGKLEELIEEINRQEDEKISCVIADGAMGWAMVAAEEMKIRRAAYLASSSWTTGLVIQHSKAS